MSEEAPPATPKRSPRRNTNFFLLLAGICICGCAGVILVPILVLPIAIQSRVTVVVPNCIENIRLVNSAISVYSVDFDEHLPPSHRWCDAIMPYMKSLGSFRCPEVSQSSYGFATNQFLEGRSLASVKEPAKAIVLFEPKNPGINASGYPVTDSAVPPRHAGRNNFAFLDGSVKAMAKPN